MGSSILRQTLGKGIYPIPMAAKLVNLSDDSYQISDHTIRRWISSYNNSKVFDSKKSVIWHPEVINIGRKKYLTFKDLIELRILKVFKKYNIHYKTIAALSKYISYQFNVDNPLSFIRLSTDGINIFFCEDEDETVVANIKSLHIVLPGVIDSIEKEIIRLKDKSSTEKLINEHDHIINNEISFDLNNQPIEWCLSPSKYKNVCMDPKICAGHPTVNYIPTSAIYNQYLVNRDFNFISKSYNIPYDLVKQAVNFERDYAR